MQTQWLIQTNNSVFDLFRVIYMIWKINEEGHRELEIVFGEGVPSLLLVETVGELILINWLAGPPDQDRLEKR